VLVSILGCDDLKNYELDAEMKKCEIKIIEFNNAGCLLISEVKYLLENRDKDAPDTPYVFL
jgi:hypothetical protein